MEGLDAADKVGGEKWDQGMDQVFWRLGLDLNLCFGDISWIKDLG